MCLYFVKCIYDVLRFKSIAETFCITAIFIFLCMCSTLFIVAFSKKGHLGLKLNMAFPVRMKILKNGHVFDEVIVQGVDDLFYSVETLTGYVKIDAAGLYYRLMSGNRKFATETFKLLNSHEKWGNQCLTLNTLYL